MFVIKQGMLLNVKSQYCCFSTSEYLCSEVVNLLCRKVEKCLSLFCFAASAKTSANSLKHQYLLISFEFVQSAQVFWPVLCM